MSKEFITQIILNAVETDNFDLALSETENIQPVDLADILSEIEGFDVWPFVQKLPDASEVFSYLTSKKQLQLVEAAPHDQLAPLVVAMAPDEQADFFKLLSDDQQIQLLSSLSKSERDDLRRLAAYPEGTAGSLMTSRFATLYPQMTAEQAIQTLRHKAPQAEMIYQAYVINHSNILIGVVSLRDLMVAQPSAIVRDIMVENVILADVEDSQEEVANLMARYSLLALPIIKKSNGKLTGIVTYDDATDATSEEVTVDFHKGAAVSTAIGNLKDATIGVLYRKRVSWLVLLVFGNFFSVMGIAHFEDIIAANLVLVFFLPLLVGSGGNAGSQSATLMVRALATGEVLMKDWFYLLGRETLVAIALGVTMGLAVSTIGWYRGGMEIAMVVSISMIAIVLIGSLIGMSLPFLLSKMKLDPASASAPLVTSICDASGVVIYLFIASALLLNG